MVRLRIIAWLLIRLILYLLWYVSGLFVMMRRCVLMSLVFRLAMSILIRVRLVVIRLRMLSRRRLGSCRRRRVIRLRCHPFGRFGRLLSMRTRCRLVGCIMLLFR